jgi:Aspartyl protease
MSWKCRSVRFHLVNRYQIIVAVSINHSGPYKFLLDTGAQITMIDPDLAVELHLETQGEASVAGLGSDRASSFAQLEHLQVGPHDVARLKVLVYRLQDRHFVDLENIHGILGEDFLEHFDMLIDNKHGLLCLDDTASMSGAVKGTRIALAAPANAADVDALPRLLMVEARLSDGTRPVRLMLDSGTNIPFLYNAPQYMSLPLNRTAFLRGSGVDGTQRIFSPLPPQEVKIGSLKLSNVLFFTVDRAKQSSHAAEFDGLLTLGLFHRVFIDQADHFAVLEP